VSDEALDNLKKIKHIVVLMMENRSFDTMLGYLQLDGMDQVKGLRGAKPNPDPDPTTPPHEVFEWGPTETVMQAPPGYTTKILDPCHSPECVQVQLEGGNTGFVKNFAATRKDEQDKSVTLPREYLRVPMGYYTAEHLPVYDYLARNFSVCDAWHSSIPGDTWPNRLYSLAGREAEPVRDKPGFLHDLFRQLAKLPGIGTLVNAPIYDVEAFTHQLDPKQWRWYSHDPATLRCADSRYRDFLNLNRDNFAYCDRKKMSVITEVAEGLAVELHNGFLDDAVKGQLRDVSWIDPNFIDLSILDPNSNDDHPPSDIHAGQILVLDLFEALVNSPDWLDTLLVVVYDEHGGFYDHMPAPSVPFEDDESQYPTLGVRVPALIVGPRVKNAVCQDLFEHTSLIATILRRFAADPEAALQHMPARVRQGPHLGGLLQAEPRPELTDRAQLQARIDQLRDRLDQWRKEARTQRRARDGQPSQIEDGGAGQKQELHDWQEKFLGFALTMRDRGLPPGQP